jgi:hypothetical protein
MNGVRSGRFMPTFGRPACATSSAWRITADVDEGVDAPFEDVGGAASPREKHAPGVNRTRDPQIKSLLLYQLSYGRARVQPCGCGREARSLAAGGNR